MSHEFKNFMWWAWDDFLRSNAELAVELGLPNPEPAHLADVDGDLIFPLPVGALPDRYEAETSGALHPDAQEYGQRHQDAPAQARAGLTSPQDFPDFAEGLQGIETLRQESYEAWLEQENLNGLVFPANADVAAADSDTNAASAESAWKNGVLYSNGNLLIRHLGIPTVTVPMGIMSDTRMPVGLTFAGPAYRDTEILGWAYAFDAAASFRVPPCLTPPLPGDALPHRRGRSSTTAPRVTIEAEARVLAPHQARHVYARGEVSGLGAGAIRLTISGIQVPVTVEGEHWRAEAVLSAPVISESSILSPKLIAVVTAVSGSGATAAAYCEV
jgi:amidase